MSGRPTERSPSAPRVRPTVGFAVAASEGAGFAAAGLSGTRFAAAAVTEGRSRRSLLRGQPVQRGIPDVGDRETARFSEVFRPSAGTG